MEQFARSIKEEIQNFLDTYVSSHSLPKANEKEKLHSLEPQQGEISEEVQDQIISHLLENFPEVKRLDRDAAEVLYDTVNFVIKTHKERENMSTTINEESTVDDVYQWLIKSGISEETSTVFKENEVDGLSILHMKESDIFTLIPGKIGAARKLCVLIDRMKTSEQPKNITHVSGYSIFEYDQNSGLKTIEIQPTEVQHVTSEIECEHQETKTPGGLHIIEVPMPNEEPGGSNVVETEGTVNSAIVPRQPQVLLRQTSLEKFIPSYSPIIQSLLEKGEIFKEWDRMIEETAYHVLTIGDFETRGIYGDFGRLMFNKYPCIGHSACKDPWGYFNKKLSQKVRNIRWRWNARGKAMNEDHTVEKSKKVCLTKVTTTEKLNIGDAEKVVEKEFKKPTKLMDLAVIARAQRETFQQRRLFIEKHQGPVDDLIKKFPFLGKCCFIEKEFFLLKPTLKKEDIIERWETVMTRVARLFMDENSETNPEVTIETLGKLEEALKYRAPKNQVLVTTCKASEWKGIKGKKDDPPRLIAVVNAQGTFQNMYIVGAGQELDTQTCLLRDGLLKLLYAYYAWDLSYPKFFQLLGFIQHYVLGDKENKFFTSNNYLKFCKRFE